MTRDIASILVIAGLLWVGYRTQPAGEHHGPTDVRSSPSDIPVAPPTPAIQAPPVEPPPAPGGAAASVDSPVYPAESIRVVLFTAKWCGLCVPTKAAAQEACASNGVKLVMLDIDQYPDYAKRWGVSNPPQILITRDGAEFSWLEGVQKRSAVGTAINRATHGSQWGIDDLRSEIADHAKTKPLDQRTRTAGMTVKYHLIRHHGWDVPTVDQLTEDEQHWLHDATHEGCILP